MFKPLSLAMPDACGALPERSFCASATCSICLAESVYMLGAGATPGGGAGQPSTSCAGPANWQDMHAAAVQLLCTAACPPCGQPQQQQLCSEAAMQVGGPSCIDQRSRLPELQLLGHRLARTALAWLIWLQHSCCMERLLTSSVTVCPS